MLKTLIGWIHKSLISIDGPGAMISISYPRWGDFLNKLSQYCKKYSESAFWRKIARYAKQIGAEAVEKLLILYFCAQDADTPKPVKLAIFGVLGYFIVPVDAIPDFTPALGFIDDIALAVYVLGLLAPYIKDEHKRKAQELLNRLFDYLKRLFD